MLIPNSTVIKVRFGPTPLLDRSGYIIEDETNNPSLQLYRGHTYQFLVNTPIEHPFRIKTQSGELNSYSYNTGIQNNGTNSSTITWTVAINAPTNLIYQSASNPEIRGLILIGDEPQATAIKKLQTTGDKIDTLVDLVEAVNRHASTTLSIYDPIAGDGLEFTDKTLKVVGNSNTVYYRDASGDLIRTVSNLVLDDNSTNITNFNPANCTLQQLLNYVAASLRMIKDSTLPWTSPVDTSLTQLQSRYDSLLVELIALKEIVERHT